MFNLYVNSDSLVAVAWSPGLKSPMWTGHSAGGSSGIGELHAEAAGVERATWVPCICHPYTMLHSQISCVSY